MPWLCCCSQLQGELLIRSLRSPRPNQAAADVDDVQVFAFADIYFLTTCVRLSSVVGGRRGSGGRGDRDRGDWGREGKGDDWCCGAGGGMQGSRVISDQYDNAKQLCDNNAKVARRCQSFAWRKKTAKWQGK